MINRKNRYGRTAARIHDADGLCDQFSNLFSAAERQLHGLQN